jgi:putative heme-binding domain-containing protein
MTEDETWKFVSFIRSIAKPEEVELKGDKSRGEAIYSGKGGCTSCHQINQRGGRIGPDLSRVGRARSATFLRESLVDPNAYLSSGYNTITVVKNDGSKIVGVQMNIDNFSVQLMDTSEKYHSFLRSEVRSVSREFKSIMPAYAQTLSGSEIDDLVAYMASLRGEEGTR